MNDPRFWPFIAVIVVSLFVAVHANNSLRWSETLKTDDRANKIFKVVVGLVLWPVMIIAAGWVDQVLWNMLAEQYGLPTLDLFSAIILGALISSLVWTTAGIRRVWVMNRA